MDTIEKFSNYRAVLANYLNPILAVLMVFAILSIKNQAAFAQSNDPAGREPFELMHLVVEPGSKVSGKLAISAGMDNIDTFIPVTVVHGSEAGPLLTLIAGIHGSEYAPIISMQRLPDLLDPAKISGTLVIVHIANMPAFQGRTIYFGPNDLKNLNRSFPGDPDGTVTDRIANTLTQELILRSDYVIDIHSGDANESLRPSYVAYYKEAGGEKVVAQSKRIAMAFGLKTIVQFAGSYDNVKDAIYTSAQAVTRGIPAIDVESGELGVINDAYVDPITVGALNVLKELNMISGQPMQLKSPLFIAERARVFSEYKGLWRSDDLVQVGSYVTEGTKLGVITDYFGNKLQIVLAPASGILLIRFGTPPVNEGDNVVVIGLLPKDDD